MESGLLAYIPGVLLMIFRTGGMIYALPFWGRADDNRWARLVVVVGLGVLFYMPSPVIVPVPAGLITFAVMAVKEILTGLLIGMGVNTIFSAVRVAGEFIGRDMGLSMARVVDPATGSGGVVLASLFELLAVLLFLALGGHHAVFRLMAGVNEVLPLGASINIEVAMVGMVNLGSLLLENGILIAAPVFTIMLLLSITMLILSRAVPQLHLMEFGFALRIVLGLLACVLFVGRTMPKLEAVFDQVLGAVGNLVVPA